MKLPKNTPSPKEIKCELKPNLLSIASMNPFTRSISASREQMFTTSHITQRLVVNNPTKKILTTGVEQEFARANMNCTIPFDCEILEVIPKFRQGMGMDSIQNVEHTPVLVIIQNLETKEVGMVELTRFSIANDNFHQHFGFRHKFTKNIQEIQKGVRFREGTKLFDSPVMDDDGNYRYGTETNVAFMSIPATTEDGIVISKSYAEKLSTYGFEKRSCIWDRNHFPLNLYGDPNDPEDYKPFPDLGEKIRPDGLLFALREYNPLLAPVDMNIKSLREVNHNFDKREYAIGDAVVIDINIIKNNNVKTSMIPEGMDKHAIKYYKAIYTYYNKILEVYSELVKKYGKNLLITPELDRMIEEAINYVGFEENPAMRHFSKNSEIFKRRVQQYYRFNKIDEWRIEITFQYLVTPCEGFKLTDCHGGKGVACEVWDDELMPVDVDGNRAELITDGSSIVKRLNVSRAYEHYISAACRDNAKKIKKYMLHGEANLEEAFNYFYAFCNTITPPYAGLISQAIEQGIKTKQEFIDEIIRDEMIYLQLPTDNPVDYVNVIEILNEYFPPTYKPVTYGGGFVTKKPVLIGSLYIMLLEKTAFDWSGVSSGKLQHFGMLAKITNSDKFSNPARNQAIRIMGESEVRCTSAIMGSSVVSDILDQFCNPASHKEIVGNILKTDKPTGIKVALDRDKVPLGNSRSVLYIKHILECAGIHFVREIDDPIRAMEIEMLKREDDNRDKGI